MTTFSISKSSLFSSWPSDSFSTKKFQFSGSFSQYVMIISCRLPVERLVCVCAACMLQSVFDHSRMSVCLFVRVFCLAVGRSLAGN